MASIYDLKPRFQAMLRPVCKHLAMAGITANMVTIAAALLSILTGLTILYNSGGEPLILLLLPVCLFIRMALNAIDGMLAREHGQKSSLGALLNELGDVISDIALYLPLGAVLVPFGLSSVMVTLFVLAAVLSEFIGVAAIMIGAERRYDGPMGKSDRAASIGVMATLLAFGTPGGWWLDLAFAILFVLCMITVANRMRASLSSGGADNA